MFKLYEWFNLTRSGQAFRMFLFFAVSFFCFALCFFWPNWGEFTLFHLRELKFSYIFLLFFLFFLSLFFASSVNWLLVLRFRKKYENQIEKIAVPRVHGRAYYLQDRIKERQEEQVNV